MANEVRLIDKDELIKRCDSPHWCVWMSEIEDFPTVDAVPVVHGEWVTLEDDWTLDTIYQCSVCKEEFVTIDGTPAENLWNYCPHCGAKMMDGDGDG